MIKKSDIEKEWRPVRGYEKTHLVSCHGEVKNLATGNILRGHKNKRGYTRVFLSVKGTSKNMAMHRLVAEAFLGLKGEKMDVNHIDFNRSNNSVANLEWTSRADNIRHSKNHNRNAKGERVGTSKIDEIQALTILTLSGHKEYNAKKLEKYFCINHWSIGGILRGSRWAHLAKYKTYNKNGEEA